MMWSVLLLLYIAHTELVILNEKDDRLILQGGDNPCDGHVEVYHDGKPGYVGDSLWDNETEETVCRSTHCGSRVEGSAEDVDIPDRVHVAWLNEVNCTGNKKHLFDCDYPGWNISVYLKETVKKIKCSNKIHIRLEEFKCAGAVQYFTDGSTPSGYFCNDEWGENETNILCKDLGCGKSKVFDAHRWMSGKDFENSKKRMISCKNFMPNNLWQCVGNELPSCKNPASVICTGYKRAQLKGNRSNVCSGRLEIEEENGKWISKTEKLTEPHEWCRQMHCGSSISHSQNDTELQCTDNVNVVLMDGGKPSKCYGTVHINVNGTHHPVCASSWTQKEAEVVCSELDCGKVVSFRRIQVSEVRGIMDNVHCSNKEASLWHCWAKHSNLKCQSKASVVCAGSIDVKLEDGPGKCAGRVEIKHEGRWKQVQKTKEWTDTNSDVVCAQMKCGKQRKNGNPEKFSQGSGDFVPNILDCKSSTLTLSDCFTNKTSTALTVSSKEAVGITCEEHKLLFLKEKEKKDKSCYGMVGIEHGDNTYWLSGSNETWNRESANIVCQQMLCGDYFNISTSIPTADMKNNVWDMSSDCLLNNKSLSECGKRTQSSDPNVTVATVFCSGSVRVNLTNKCWGNVNICFDNKCGGVCADTWTEKQSEMLCESWKCGKPITNKDTQPVSSAVIVKSLHSTKQTTSLAHYSFVMNRGNSKSCNPANVVCSGCLKPRFNLSRGKCYGNVEVRYEGNFLPVCTTALTDKKTQDIICKNLNCGQAIGKIDHLGPPKTGVPAISHIQCSKSSLQTCNITTTRTNCTYAGLQCTEWRKMKLSKTCEGEVFVYSEGKRKAVSAEGWKKKERDRLCQDMECGNSSSLYNRSRSEKQNIWNRTFSCSRNSVTNIWDCEKETPPSKKEQLFIECQDKPSVTLSNHCHGEVKIDNIQVCSSQWNMDYSHLICHEKKCSNAIYFDSTKPKDKKEYYHVNCANDHELGQCKRVKGKCDGQPVSVFCVGSVRFNTTEKCGGVIEVNYRGKWERVCPTVLSTTVKKMLCKELGCEDYIDRTITKKEKVEDLSTSLECTDNHKNISFCVRRRTCNKVYPAEIYCKGYVPTVTTRPVPESINVLPIILGIGLCLILIAIIVFVRICFFKKSKNVMNIPLRMQSRKEVEFESGDYEDVRADEMDDFSRRRFRSEAEIITENDARSASSISYDDIDEAAEAQPLTSQATTAGASRDNHNREDGVTYEVDDPQENYDDIEGNPETTQAQAEVHNSPQTTPENKAVDPPGLVQGDVDYLVPGQDG